MADLITISSRTPGFAWAGRLWTTAAVVVQVGLDEFDRDDLDLGDGGKAEIRISETQYAELRRQCAYTLFPLRIGRVDAAVEQLSRARGDLASLKQQIDAERQVLEQLHAERAQADRLLAAANGRLREVERKLTEAQDALAAAEARADAAEAKQIEVEVEPKPDPNRSRN